MKKFRSSPRLFLSWMLSLVLCYTALAQQPRTDKDRIPLHSFASGQAFYIEKSSFKPIGNGTLQYNVTSDTGSGSQRASKNEINCQTGQMKSPLQSWNEDSKGTISSRTDGPSVTTTLTNRTRLYDDMKDACQQAMPTLKMNW